MVKANYCISFDREIMEWIEKNRTKENTPSKMLSRLVRAEMSSKKDNCLAICDICGAEHAESIKCPTCLRIENQKEMEKINKVLEEKDLKKEEGLKAKEDEIKKERISTLNTQLARRRVNLKISEEQGDKEQIDLDTKAIQRIEKELV